MTRQTEAILMIAGMAALAQLLGSVLSRLFRKFHDGPWVWALTAGGVFSIEWYLLLGFPARREAEAGHPACSAAGALLLVGIVVLGPASAIIGALLHVLGAFVARRRARSHGQIGRSAHC
jgi:hypothetical protein